MAVLNHDGLL